MLEFGLPLTPYVISFLISITIAVYTFQNRQVRGAVTFAFYAVWQAQWTIGYIFELIAPSLQEKIFWDNFQYIGSFFVPVAIFVFALAYTTSISLKNLTRLSIGLVILPLISTVLAFTNEVHGLTGSNFVIIPNQPFDILYYDLGIALGLIAGYSYLLSFWGLGMLLNYTRKVNGIFRMQVWYIIIGLVIPLSSSLSFIAGITLWGQRDFQPITFGLGNIFVAIGLFQYQFFNIVPTAREKVLQAMRDAVIVLDNDQRIIDINPSAQDMLFAGKSPMGKLVNEVLVWLTPHIATHNIHTEVQILDAQKQVYYELITNDILNDNDEQSGMLILIRDVTEKMVALRTIEDARFQAELLADISDAMNNAQTEDDLLVAFSAVLIQYMPTRIALMYVDYEDSGIIQLRTVALQNEKGENLPIDTFNRLMTFSADQFPVVYRLLGTDTTLYIENIHTNDWLGEKELMIISQTRFLAMIIVPLRTQERHEGFMVINWDSYQTFPESLRMMIELLAPRLAENITARRAYLQAQQAQQETEQFYRLSQAINTAITYTQILDAFADVFGPFKYSVVLMVAENYDFATSKQAHVVGIIRPNEKTAHAIEDVLPVWDPRTGDDSLLQIDNIADYIQAHPDDERVHLVSGVQALLGIDCVLGGRAIGRIGFSSDKPYRFSGFEKRLIRGLSDLVAAALERARLYQEQVQIAEQLRALDQMKSQFLASMSHELRTPLNAILNFTEFVSLGMLGEVNDKQKDALGKSLDSARHLLSLINDVLDMTKIEAGMMKLFIEDNIDLIPELNTLIATSQTLLGDKAVVLITDIDPYLPRIVGDKRRIRQILLNLLSNACKFTEKGSITLSVKKRQDELLFAVIDTGPGISPDDQDIIFEPFRQTEQGVKHAGGTGLGLPITKKLIEVHGGKLWLESEVGQGASFYLTLPIHSEALITEMQQSLA